MQTVSEIKIQTYNDFCCICTSRRNFITSSGLAMAGIATGINIITDSRDLMYRPREMAIGLGERDNKESGLE